MRANGVINNWRLALKQSEQVRQHQLRDKENSNWRALSLLVQAAKPEHTSLAWGVFFLCVATGLDVLGPMLGKYLIDTYLSPRLYQPTAIISLLLAILISGCLASYVRYLQLARLAGLAMRSVQRVREQVYQHVLSLPMSFFDKAITGQLVSRVTNDTESVKALYVQVLFVLLDSGILLIGTMVAMAFLDWRLMLIAFLLVPTVIGIVRVYQRWSSPAVARTRQLRSDINAQMAESIGGMSVLQAANASSRFNERFANTNAAHYDGRLQEIRANAWLLRPALDMLNILLTVLIIYSFSQREINALEIGVLYAFISYIGRVIDPLIQITLQFSQLQQAIIATARVTTLLDEKTASVNQSTHHLSQGSIAIRDLHFGYNTEQDVLHGLNLTIPAGGFYGIVGHTGSGKSTLLALMLRFYPDFRGEIVLDDMALNSIGNDAFRADVGLVPQDPFLLAASAFENIDMGRGLSQAQVETAARAAKAHDFICALEDGYATQLGEGGGRLSTGQKQLIAIARALAGQPKILFLDEATAHIDSETEQVVQVALSQLRGKVTIVAIAHRLSTIRDADQIVVLNHGKISEQGPHDALMAIEGGIYQRLYLLQQLGE